MPDEPSTTRRQLLRTAGATLGAAGVAGCSGTPFSTDRPPSVTPAPLPPTETPTPTATPLSATVAPVALVDFAFEPGTETPLVVPVGTTVRFVWRTASHNVRVDERPPDSAWAGHEPIEDAGFVHAHRFAVEGRYEFHCDPHRGLGMVGTLLVV